MLLKEREQGKQPQARLYLLYILIECTKVQIIPFSLKAYILYSDTEVYIYNTDSFKFI